jgi:hypothetical protein
MHETSFSSSPAAAFLKAALPPSFAALASSLAAFIPLAELDILALQHRSRKLC